MAGIDGILESQQKTEQANSNKSKTASDKDMFLKLLVTQLTYQDPLNPVEDKEFIAQLAQFTSVEELQNIRGSMDDFITMYDTDRLTKASTLIGRRVLAEGDQIQKTTQTIKGKDGAEDKQVPATTYALLSSENAVENCVVSVINPDTKQTVFSTNIGSISAGGSKTFQWSGLRDDGTVAPDGYYTIQVTARNATGKTQIVKTQVLGDVLEVAKQDGEYYLQMLDGRRIKYKNTTNVTIALSGGDGENGNAEGNGDDKKPEKKPENSKS